MIVKNKNNWETVHCHGKNKGKTISKFKTKKEALKQHKAIMASKAKRKALMKLRSN